LFFLTSYSSDGEWWFVEHCRTSEKGYVPSSYVAVAGSLEAEEWYIPRISRKDSERLLLLNSNTPGTFMVRDSETSHGSLTLSVRDREFDSATNRATDTVKHYRVNKLGSTSSTGFRYYISTKRSFPSLRDLVEHYSTEADGLCSRLTRACPRPPPLTSDLSVQTKDHWEIPRTSITLLEKLGAGQFGEVWKDCKRHGLLGTRYIHRDLAARNILVGENNAVKIADFGLARMVVEERYETYVAQNGTKLPIKWTAPEAALSGRFTVKSDVWSFGIVIYEIITHGQVPYPSMNNTETLNQVSTGYRMPRPANCPEGVYEIMLKTWDATPERRPQFEYLCTYFEEYFVSPEPSGFNHSNTNASPGTLSLRCVDKMASMDNGDNLTLMAIEPGESIENEEEEELEDSELMNLARNIPNQINGNHHSHQRNHRHGRHGNNDNAPTPMAVV
uniref:Tyrosine-protein kinase n=1 Tax=Rodentolepis nana TaxID=102285 RepID=A0A158QGN6_RODNA